MGGRDVAGVWDVVDPPLRGNATLLFSKVFLAVFTFSSGLASPCW
jgi:hypothetical protein